MQSAAPIRLTTGIITSSGYNLSAQAVCGIAPSYCIDQNVSSFEYYMLSGAVCADSRNRKTVRVENNRVWTLNLPCVIGT
jgi:hypothetical protein